MADRVICLPTGTAVRPEDIRKICHLLRLVVDHSAEISLKLSKPIVYHKAVA